MRSFKKIKKTKPLRKLNTTSQDDYSKQKYNYNPRGMGIEKNISCLKWQKKRSYDKGNLRDAIEKAKAKGRGRWKSSSSSLVLNYLSLCNKNESDPAEKFGMGGDVKGKKGHICRRKSIASVQWIYIKVRLWLLKKVENLDQLKVTSIEIEEAQ